MFLLEKNLPLHSKALAWAVVSVVASAAFWVACDAVRLLFE